jgi:hypothetical protein
MKSNIQTAVDALVMSTATNGLAAAGLCHSDECRYCSTGKQNLCDAGLYADVGMNAVQGARYAGAKKYTLDEINDGYQDLMDGKNIRGVVVHQH